ncbi:MAG: hypothetical protein ABII25_02000, partial [bacterium]
MGKISPFGRNDKLCVRNDRLCGRIVIPNGSIVIPNEVRNLILTNYVVRLSFRTAHCHSERERGIL